MNLWISICIHLQLPNPDPCFCVTKPIRFQTPACACLSDCDLPSWKWMIPLVAAPKTWFAFHYQDKVWKRGTIIYRSLRFWTWSNLEVDLKDDQNDRFTLLGRNYWHIPPMGEPEGNSSSSSWPTGWDDMLAGWWFQPISKLLVKMGIFLR